jgi:hypothetical protein
MLDQDMSRPTAPLTTLLNADLLRDAPRKSDSASGEWPDPDRNIITDDRVAAPALDHEALPAGWGPWISAEGEGRGCPPDYVAGALLAAASAWIGNSRRAAPTATWTEPAQLWFANVGKPSTGKTPALSAMAQVSRELEREEERDTESAQRDDDSPPPKPRIIAMDTSTDELQHMLSRNPRGLLYVRDELAGWIGSFDRYNGKGADRAFCLECWNGGSYVCDRVKYRNAPVRIEHASLAILGGIVPDRLRELVIGAADDGLIARMMFIWPDPVPIRSLSDRGGGEAAERREMLMTAARQLRQLKMGADQYDTPAPRALPLSIDALALFDRMRAAEMQRSRDLHGLAAGWREKNPGRILRLALTYELLRSAADDGLEPTAISHDAIARAGRYIDYAAAMFERVIGGLAISRDEADAALIARHLTATGPARLNERELSRMPGFSWARDRQRRAAALLVLAAGGWIRQPAPASSGGRPARDWDVSPHLATSCRRAETNVAAG